MYFSRIYSSLAHIVVDCYRFYWLMLAAITIVQADARVHGSPCTACGIGPCVPAVACAMSGWSECRHAMPLLLCCECYWDAVVVVAGHPHQPAELLLLLWQQAKESPSTQAAGAQTGFSPPRQVDMRVFWRRYAGEAESPSEWLKPHPTCALEMGPCRAAGC